ncbi:hypothetical protein F901_02605 [Acinetobacter dispersus]|uniref:hypothetical protein n=1 Tax=Acinetobacter dispersus TaxID=70348 RepID=UPI0002CE9623|nr:hypothetical protein [Acinetobacter dispersus]ENX52872.1 hypothetical protein F901_02605 [Acinetobacter dispersus]
MHSDDFVEKLRENLLIDYVQTYREIYESTQIDNKIEKDPYWFSVLSFYNSLKENEKDVLFKIIQQTVVDTTSNILGIIDGPVYLEGFNGDFSLSYQEGKDQEVILNGDLQDSFLSIVHTK